MPSEKCVVIYNVSVFPCHISPLTFIYLISLQEEMTVPKEMTMMMQALIKILLGKFYHLQSNPDRLTLSLFLFTFTVTNPMSRAIPRSPRAFFYLCVPFFDGSVVLVF